MARPTRKTTGGYFYHVLNRANGRLRIFKKRDDFLAFERVLGEAQKRTEMRICGYSIMSNHWHLLLRPYHDFNKDLNRYHQIEHFEPTLLCYWFGTGFRRGIFLLFRWRFPISFFDLNHATVSDPYSLLASVFFLHLTSRYCEIWCKNKRHQLLSAPFVFCELRCWSYPALALPSLFVFFSPYSSCRSLPWYSR